MSPILENLIGGAASVKLVPTRDYNKAAINAFYDSQASRRGVAVDEALIKRVAIERLIGQMLFMVLNLGFMVATLMLATRSGGWAIVTALTPLALTFGIVMLEGRIKKPLY